MLQSVVRHPARLATTLEELGITHFVGVPTLLRALAPHLRSTDGECVQRLYGGAKHSENNIVKWNETHAVYHFTLIYSISAADVVNYHR